MEVFSKVNATLSSEIRLSKDVVKTLHEIGIKVDLESWRISGNLKGICEAEKVIKVYHAKYTGSSRKKSGKMFEDTCLVDADVFNYLKRESSYTSMIKHYKVEISDEFIAEESDIVNLKFQSKMERNLADCVSYFKSLYEKTMRFVDRVTLDLTRLKELRQSEIEKAVKKTKKQFPRADITISKKFTHVLILAPHGRTAVEAKAKLASALLKSNPNISSDAVFFNESFSQSYKGFKLNIGSGNIAEQNTMAIVNAANDFLQYGGGVTGAIYDMGGTSFMSECNRFMDKRGDKLKVGEVVHTSGEHGDLRCNYVLHVLGPVWYNSDPTHNKAGLLLGLNSLFEECEKLKLSSVALPPVSTGIYGGPLDVFVEVFCEALGQFEEKMKEQGCLKEIRLVTLDCYTVDDMVKYYHLFAPMAATKLKVAKSLGEASPPAETLHAQESNSQADPLDPVLKKLGSDTAKGKTREGYDEHDLIAKPGEKSINTKKLKSADKSSSTKFENPEQNQVAEHSGKSDDEYFEHLRYQTDDKPVRAPISTTADAESTTLEMRERAGSKSPRVSVEFGQNLDKTEQDQVLEKRNEDFKSSNLECVICHDTETGLMVSLDCGHKYHQTCVIRALKLKSCCPVCGYIVGVPKADILEGATMTHSYLESALPGYEGYDTIKIKYHVPDGIQGPNHPNPGHVYTGTYRTGYLPNCTEGIEVFQLLRKAFDAGLIFTVGTSLTTGVPNTVVWNDIHHKTDFTGTYGYPDPGYLMRVKEDLKAKGIY